MPYSPLRGGGLRARADSSGQRPLRRVRVTHGEDTGRGDKSSRQTGCLTVYRAGCAVPLHGLSLLSQGVTLSLLRLLGIKLESPDASLLDCSPLQDSETTPLLMALSPTGFRNARDTE
jgi:hypothetical protein